MACQEGRFFRKMEWYRLGLNPAVGKDSQFFS